ncbi:unnamed protein product, partial [Gadus morhua 'NCC']
SPAPDVPPTPFDLGISPPSFGDEHPSPPDDSSSPSPGETTTAGPGSPRFLGHGINENLIPVYCSILAAVVVGLVAYIVFKRWNSCKQNKQPANNRAAAANQTVSPEGEKLHSDSGISVDSQSLQEQQAHAHGLASRSHTQEHIVVRVDGGPQPDSPPPQGSDDTTLKAAELGRKGGGADGGERHSRSGDPTGQVTRQVRAEHPRIIRWLLSIQTRVIQSARPSTQKDSSSEALRQPPLMWKTFGPVRRRPPVRRQGASTLRPRCGERRQDHPVNTPSPSPNAMGREIHQGSLVVFTHPHDAAGNLR